VTFRGYKLHVVLIAFVVCLGTALGVQRLVYGQRVVEPLERAFAAIPGVVEVVLEPRGGETDIVLHVEPGAELPRVYREAEAAARARLGDRLGKIVLADQRTPALVDAFYKMHLTLHEGAATGRFTEMAEQLDAMAAELSLTDYRVFVDDERVYVLLVSDDGYLYETVARPAAPVRGSGG